MGYGRKQMDDLAETIKRSAPDLVLIGTPIDLRRLIDFERAGDARHLSPRGDRRADAGRRPRRARPDRRAHRSRLTLVLALGGNALGRGTAAEQLTTLRGTCAAIEPLVREGEVVVTHGNGPQVGNELLRQERAADEVPPLPLYLAVAQTQGEIGAMLETELAAAVARAGRLPAHARARRSGRSCVREPVEADRPVLRRRRGARRSSASAAGSSSRTRGAAFGGSSRRRDPLEVVELDAIRALVSSGAIDDRLRRRRDSRRQPRRSPEGSRRRDRQGPRVGAPRRARSAPSGS